ncbi:glycosyltransferase family 2 protein [Candidatus Pseudothioglobus singularis]|jgi:glycosyltransferase involved in cell wall biosynthesis|nr:glycosyltransferase family 2 protein [Candidatus Pseudothioglobus singularis]
MKFDVIIATCNRKQSLMILVNQLLSCSKLPENIIIVDSSETFNHNIVNINLVKYIQSNHQNQPYQRYVGFLASKSEILIYLDDDMRILDNECFNKILSFYQNKNIVGVQPNFRYVHNFFDNKMPKSKTRQLAKKNLFLKFLKFLSGSPNINNGKFWLAGIRGNKPKNGEIIQWFSGPIFSAKKNFLYLDFNFSILDFYEISLGKAEDAILGFTLSRQGDLLYLSEELFAHDDQDDSIYSLDFASHAFRVAHSRLYLSFEYARLINFSKILAFLHFNLYIFGRIGSMALNQFIDYKPSRKLFIKGYLKGYYKALKDFNKLLNYDNGVNWKKEAIDEISLNFQFKSQIKD